MNIIMDLIPAGRRNRPGLKLRGPEYITIHSTANTRIGANAEMHGRYLRGGAADIPASWHFTVDDKEIRQHLPLDEVGWHAGDGREGPGNRSSVGLEICENQDGNLKLAVINAAELTAWLMTKFKLDPGRVKQHYHWSGKNCPRIFRYRVWGSWEKFLRLVSAQLENNEDSGEKDTGNEDHGGPFPDMPVDHWAAEYINWAYEKGLVKGTPDGRFAGDEKWKEQKAELVVMFRRFYDLLQKEEV